MPTDQRPASPGTLDDVLADAWRRLQRGARDRRHGFRLPTIATVDADDHPAARTVVLRAVDRDRRELACFSDARSPKIAQLRRRPWSSWTFWDRGGQVQVRACGPTHLQGPDDDDEAAHAWASMDPRSRRPWFAEAAPGLELDAPGDGLPPDLDPDDPSVEQLARARSAFRRVGVIVEQLDWLSLRGEHRRARFTWRGGECTSSWCRP